MGKKKSLDWYYDIYKYPVSKEEWFRRFNRIKAKLQNEWKDKIQLRDGDKCVVCGREKNLQLCHITSIYEFIRMYATRNNKILPWDNLEEIMRLSYRYDNLLTMCASCHLADHNKSSNNRYIRNRVMSTRRSIIRKRGWGRAVMVIDYALPDDTFNMDEIEITSVNITVSGGKDRPVFSASPKYVPLPLLAGWDEVTMKEQYPWLLKVIKKEPAGWVFTERLFKQSLRIEMNKRRKKEGKERAFKDVKHLAKLIERDINGILRHGLKRKDEKREL